MHHGVKSIRGATEDEPDVFLDPLSYHRLPIGCEQSALSDDGTYTDPEPSLFFYPQPPSMMLQIWLTLQQLVANHICVRKCRKSDTMGTW